MLQSTGSCQAWKLAGTANPGKHWKVPSNLKQRQVALGGCKLEYISYRFMQCGTYTTGAWAPVSVPILELTGRHLGEIGFNFPNYEAGKTQSVSFTTQLSYFENEVKQYVGREFRLTLLFHGAPKYI